MKYPPAGVAGKSVHWLRESPALALGVHSYKIAMRSRASEPGA
ncbi:MAG: hypothetical protein WBQ86_21885 [Candidatus Binatus sp.]